MGLIPGLTQWVEDLVLLWLWYRLAATAPIRPLAWELSYATGVVLKRQKKVVGDWFFFLFTLIFIKNIRRFLELLT